MIEIAFQYREGALLALGGDQPRLIDSLAKPGDFREIV